MKRKIFATLLVVVLMLSLVVGCANDEQTVPQGDTSKTDEIGQSTKGDQQKEQTDNRTFTIGFSQCTLASPFYTSMKTTIEEYAKEIGVKVVVVSADDDVQKQNNDILDLISSGIDALILNPINTEGVQTGIDACVEKNIPVITVDRLAASGATAAVVRDNKEMGKLVGEELLRQLGGADKATGTILELQGTSGDQVMMDRRDGFESAFKDVPGIKIVQSPYCDYTRSKAIAAAQDMIQANSDIVAIYGHNDDMALGGMQAAQEANLKDVKICGVDGLMEAVEAMVDGNYACTSLNDPGTEIKVALDTAVKVLKGENVEAIVDAGTGLVNNENAESYYDKDLVFAAMKGDE